MRRVDGTLAERALSPLESSPGYIPDGIGNRELQMMGGVARWRYSQFTEGELNAIYDYLVEFARGGVSSD